MIIGKFIIKFHSPITIEREAGYMKEVIDLLKKGLIINAIKIYKHYTGVGLKDAYDYVVNVLKPKYYKPNKTTIAFMDAAHEQINNAVHEQVHKKVPETTDELRDEIAKYQATQFNK